MKILENIKEKLCLLFQEYEEKYATSLEGFLSSCLIFILEYLGIYSKPQYGLD